MLIPSNASAILAIILAVLYVVFLGLGLVEVRKVRIGDVRIL